MCVAITTDVRVGAEAERICAQIYTMATVNLCEAPSDCRSGAVSASQRYTSERSLCNRPSSVEAHAESEKTNSL